MKPRIPRNVFSAIEARRYGPYSPSMKSSYRYHNRLMANLIASPNWLFKKVMRIRSSGSVIFDCHDKIYCENNRKCYIIRGARGKPMLMHSVNRHLYGEGWRYEAQVTITQCRMSAPDLLPCDLRILLTSFSSLEIRNTNNGNLMYIVDLASKDTPTARFNTLTWDMNLDQIVTTSTRPKTDPDIYCYIMILKIRPKVQKSLLIPIRRSVFGRLTNLILFDGMFQAMYHNGTVKVYDFKKVFDTNEKVDGIDVKILQIKDLGTPSYEVCNTDSSVTFGGYPWQYITGSERAQQSCIYTIDHEMLAKFEVLEGHNLSFHPDESGTITHFTKDAVNFYKMVPQGIAKRPTLKKIREMTLVEEEDPDSDDRLFIPRRRKRSVRASALPFSDSYFEKDTPVLVADDYENELNVNLLMGKLPKDLFQRAAIQFFDNETGAHLRSMKFSRKLDNDNEYSMTLDLDVLMVFANREGRNQCEGFIYRLLNKETWLETDEDPPETYELPSTARPYRERDLDFVP